MLKFLPGIPASLFFIGVEADGVVGLGVEMGIISSHKSDVW